MTSSADSVVRRIINIALLFTGKQAIMASGPAISTADATNFPVPGGTKVTVDIGGPPIQLYPVLRWGHYTYWPLSYIDNRVCMAIVITDSARNIIQTLEATGARYINEIQINASTREVYFIGQAGQVATLSWNALFVAPTVNQRPLTNAYSKGALVPAITSMNNIENVLNGYFSGSKKEYTDDDFNHIAQLLRRTECSKYSKTPRLYTLLRFLGRLDDLDRLLKSGLFDYSLPLSDTQLPSDFTQSWKKEFLYAQHLVCDNSDVVQMISMEKHMNFVQEPGCFIRERFIGEGGRGKVDEVFCIFSGQSYARKQILRQIMSVSDVAAAAAFRNEVENIKRVIHHHCVQLVRFSTHPYALGECSNRPHCLYR